MTTLTRWKLACALLAAIAGYSTLSARTAGGTDTPVPTVTAARAGGVPQHLRRPLRISAEAAGVSHAELVDRALAARTARELQLLADKLGAVGTDATVDQLAPLLSDPRRYIPETVLGIYGQIGTEHAVAALLSYLEDDRPAVRTAAIGALGATQSAKAESVLVPIALDPTDPAQSTAIGGLGTIGSDRAVATLARIAETADSSTASSAVYALGAADTAAARAALRKLVDAPDLRIAAAAISSLPDIDEELMAKLAELVKVGDPQVINAALSALGRAGASALPILRTAALEGVMSARWYAVSAIGEIGGPDAIATLGEIMKKGDRHAASAAAQALAANGGAEARELLIEAALSDRAQLTGALAQLAQLEGEDVEQALISVMKQGTGADRRAALPRLLKTGNPDALALAKQLALKGNRNERYEVMRMLTDAGTQPAFDALVDVAGQSRGQTRVNALDMLAMTRPADAAVGQLLADSLFSGRRDEAHYAASVLGRIGTEDAREALIAALSGKDEQLAVAAAGALGQVGMTAHVKSAMLAAARANPQVKSQVMLQLVQAGAPEGLRLAEDMLTSGEPGAATSAVWALANQGTEQARRLVERALDSKDPQTRIAAISSLTNNPDDRTADTLLRLARDADASVRASALQTLGQIGGERAQQALIDATRSGSTEDRVAAISGLTSLDDPRTSQTLASLMRDRDPQVAQQAVYSSYNAGPEVDPVLVAIVNDPSSSETMRSAAASQLRSRGTDLDERTEKALAALGYYGGYGYGGIYH